MFQCPTIGNQKLNILQVSRVVGTPKYTPAFKQPNRAFKPSSIVKAISTSRQYCLLWSSLASVSIVLRMDSKHSVKYEKNHRKTPLHDEFIH